MNELAREALIAAALKGHKQIIGKLHNTAGECALGVLHLLVHKTRVEAIECAGSPTSNAYGCSGNYSLKFDLSLNELSEIADANDLLGWDFLTIARKCCLPKDEECPS